MINEKADDEIDKKTYLEQSGLKQENISGYTLTDKNLQVEADKIR